MNIEDALFITRGKNYCFPWCTKLNEQFQNNVWFDSKDAAEKAGYQACSSCTHTIIQESWEDHNTTLRLFVPHEFSFSKNVEYLSRSSDECLFHIENQKIYKAIAIESHTALIEISEDSESHILIRFLNESTPNHKWMRAAIARYVKEWFDLDTNLEAFYQLAKNDFLLREIVSKFYGLRNMGIPDLFEAISWGIIGQQINLAFAYTLKKRLTETFGRYVEYENERHWIFPRPHDIAKLDVEDLKEIKMTTKKCEYLIGVAKLLTTGELTKEKILASGTLAGAEKVLTNIRGIGPWTANYVLMRCLRIPSAFPIDDVGLHNAIKHLMKSTEKPTKEEILTLSLSWANWESYATFYLWKALY